MSHNITEADAFTTPVVVPDGTDDHMLLSSYMLAFVQALANRTKNLKDHSAVVDDTNDFTDLNTFEALLTALTGIEVNNSADASVAALVTRTTAADDPHSGNKYKAVLGHNIAGGIGYVNVYAGRDTSEAQYVIALNAVWDTAAQHWGVDNAAVPSLALLFVQGSGLRISVRPAGAGTWTTWPSTDGNLSAGGTVHGDALDSSTSVTTVDVGASGTVTAAHVVATHDIAVPTPTDGDETKGYEYSDPNFRTFMLPLFSALGGQIYEDLYSDGFKAVYQANGVTGIGDMVVWPISVPPGCHIGEIRVRHVMSSTVVGANDEFILMKRSGITGNWSTVSTTTASGAGGAAQTTTAHPGGDETALTDTEYALRWIVHNTDLTVGLHRVRAIELDVYDVGPRNKVN